MKKVYVLGCFANKGVIGNDSPDLDSYMELGWEIMTTGFWAKNNLDSSSYICTTRDRLFMYSHITKNLIPWEELSNHQFDEVNRVYQAKFTLLKEYNESEWTEKMKESLKNNAFPLSNESGYVCVQIRRRDHCTHRNGNTQKWLDFVWELSKKYNKVFIVGQGNENEQLPPNARIVNIDEYCSLIKSEGCVASVGNSSGCMALNYIYGRKGLPVFIHYTEDIRTQRENHILFFGEKTNVSPVEPNLYLDINSLINDFYKKVIY
jgi:hypothetical protein